MPGAQNTEGILGSPLPPGRDEEIRWYRKVSMRTAFSTLMLLQAVTLGLMWQLTETQLPVVDQTIDSWFNVHGSHGCVVNRVLEPETEAQIVEVVRHASKMRERLKVVGTGLGYAPVVCSNEPHVVLVSLRRHNKLVEVDHDGRTALVEAGITISDLHEKLLPTGLVLPGSTFDDRHTLGGAISMGAHGSSLHHGSLATLIKEVTIVDSLGRIRRLSPDMDDLARDTFNSVVHGLGVMGVVSSVKLKLVSRFYLTRAETWIPDVATYISSLAPMAVEQHDYFHFYWYPQTSKGLAVSLRKEHTQTSPGALGSLKRQWRSAMHRGYVFSLWLESWFSFLTPTIHGRLSGWGVGSDVDVAHVMLKEPLVAHQSFAFEVFVPADKATSAFVEVRRTLGEEIAKPGSSLNYNSHVLVRYVQGDSFYLSPAYQRDSVSFTFSLVAQTETKNQGAHELMERLLVSLDRFDVRVSWQGVVPRTLSTKRAKTMYPKWDAFRHERAKIDPEGTFLNQFGQTMFQFSLEEQIKKEKETAEETQARLEQEEKDKAEISRQEAMAASEEEATKLHAKQAQAQQKLTEERTKKAKSDQAKRTEQTAKRKEREAAEKREEEKAKKDKELEQQQQEQASKDAVQEQKKKRTEELAKGTARKQAQQKAKEADQKSEQQKKSMAAREAETKTQERKKEASEKQSERKEKARSEQREKDVRQAEREKAEARDRIQEKANKVNSQQSEAKSKADLKQREEMVKSRDRTLADQKQAEMKNQEAEKKSKDRSTRTAAAQEAAQKKQDRKRNAKEAKEKRQNAASAPASPPPLQGKAGTIKPKPRKRSTDTGNIAANKENIKKHKAARQAARDREL